MRREFHMALTVVVCGILGVTNAMIVKTMYERGVIIEEFITGSITLTDLQFLIFFLWLIVGIIIGVLKS